MKRKEYYSLSRKGQNVSINIYGEICKYAWYEGDFGSTKLAKELAKYDQIDNIDVYINSNGGSVSEGLAVYNILKRHTAKVTTYCDGFACSAASVIFMAGDERVMSNASLLMIHNAWIYTAGNANELRKQADDLDTITEASINAYMNHVNITREELKQMLDNETWIDCEEALEKGFCTSIVQEDEQTASQSVSMKVLQLIKNKSQNSTSDVTHADNNNSMSNTGVTNDELFNSFKMFMDSLEKPIQSKEEKEKKEEKKDKKINKTLNFFRAISEKE